MEKLYKVEDAAAVLSVSPRTLRNWLCKKKMNYVKVLGATRIRAEDMQALLKPAILPKPPKCKRSPKKSLPMGTVERILRANIKAVNGPELKEAGQ